MDDTRPRPNLVVFGNRVRDISLDVDLPTIYRADRTLQDDIRIEDHHPIVRDGSVIYTEVGEHRFEFAMRLDLSEMKDEEKKRTQFSVEGQTYYRLHAGSKYLLLQPPARGPGARDIALPCLGRSWGGGGLNLACACRGLSDKTTTPITYVDTSWPLSNEPWFSKFWDRFRTGQALMGHENLRADLELLMGVVKEAVSIFPPGGEAVADATQVVDIVSRVQRRVENWLGGSGERAARVVTEIMSVFDPLESADLFLTLHGIRFAMLRLSAGPAPMNYIFSQVRDAAVTINDKIIFRGPRSRLEREKADAVASFVQREIPEPGAIVVNTIHDAGLFWGALQWAKEVQKSQANSVPEHNICPVVLALTERNLTHFGGAAGLSDACRDIRNLYILFNEEELGKLIEKDRRAADSFRSTVSAGLLPEEGPTKALLAELDVLLHDPDHHVIITMGSLGSLGFSQGRMSYVGTYSVPTTRTYGTTGCGDAFAAGVALLVHHRHNHNFDGIRRGNLLTGRWEGVEADLTLMMQLGTAAAFSKLTHPLGTVSARDVRSLLEGAYLPTTTPPIALGDLRSTSKDPIPRPLSATIVGVHGALKQILTGRPLA